MIQKFNVEAYSKLTEEYLSNRPKKERAPLGQFITPRHLREALVGEIELRPGMKVLDPGVGTGEFLATCLEYQPKLEVEGWDIDEEVAKVARQLVPQATIKVQSALTVPISNSFDVVIGNPPYFEIPHLDPVLKNKFKQVIGGRPNIFSLFFEVGLTVLKPGGVLGFVVPPSMNNGAYFSKLRNFILKQSSIEFLKVYKNSKLFPDAQTAIQLIVLRKGPKSNNFSVDLGELGKSDKTRTIFVENKQSLVREFHKRSTLWNLGYEATTGTLIWNQNRNKLQTTRKAGCVALIWAHNIGENRLVELDELHPKKPQYVETKNFIVGPAIVVNRITGNVGHGSLRCAIVPEGVEFLGENHVNIIKRRADVPQLVDWDELLDLLRRPEINTRIQKLTGNTQISCVELTYYLPLEKEIINTNPTTLF